MYNNVSAWMLLHQNNYDYTVMFPNLRVLIIKYNIDTYAIIDKFIKTLPKSLSYLELIASSIYDMVESLKLSDEILPNLTHLITGTNVELTNMNSLKSVNCDNYTFINTCDNLLSLSCKTFADKIDFLNITKLILECDPWYHKNIQTSELPRTLIYFKTNYHVIGSEYPINLRYLIGSRFDSLPDGLKSLQCTTTSIPIPNSVEYLYISNISVDHIDINNHKYKKIYLHADIPHDFIESLKYIDYNIEIYLYYSLIDAVENENIKIINGMLPDISDIIHFQYEPNYD